MRAGFPVLLLAVLAACSPPRPPAPSGPVADPTDVVEAMTRARDARLAGDRAGYLRNVRIADSLAPGHPTLLLSLARAYALAGDTAAALRTLERIAPYGLALGVAEDSVFRLLRGRPEIAELSRRLAGNAAPVVRSDTAILVPDPDLIPESIGYDPVTGTFYLGSLAWNKVVRVTPRGEVVDFARVGRAGRIIGIKVDPRRRELWAVTVVRDARAPRTFAGTGGHTALLRYDLLTGRLTGRFPPDPDELAHSFNDIATSLDGYVYVTDQFGNAVYRIAPGGTRMELFYGGDRGFHWPNGIDFSPDGSRLYVAHLEGISMLDVRSRKLTRLRSPGGVATADVDGLYACRTSLVAVQRMPDFEQVTRLRLSPSGDAVVAAEVLERRHPAYAQPTTGVIVGDALYYIASSQFARLSDGRLVRAERPVKSVILHLPLGEECRPLA